MHTFALDMQHVGDPEKFDPIIQLYGTNYCTNLWVNCSCSSNMVHNLLYCLFLLSEVCRHYECNDCCKTRNTILLGFFYSLHGNVHLFC